MLGIPMTITSLLYIIVVLVAIAAVGIVTLNVLVYQSAKDRRPWNRVSDLLRRRSDTPPSA